MKCHKFVGIPQQLVGDTEGYSREGTAYATRYVKQRMNENINSVMWYGYTGRRGYNNVAPQLNDLQCWGANQILNELMASEPALAKRVIGNVVYFHTTEAVISWRCDLSEHVRNFYLVYNSLEPKCEFGDDTTSSDGLTTTLGICLDGGIQSFRQVVYMLANNIKVEGIANLRGPKNPSTFNPQTNTYTPYFSAAEFLNVVKKYLFTRDINQITANDMEEVLKQYMTEKLYFKPSSKDAHTKPKLLKLAWTQFINEKIWLKLEHHYTGIDYQTPNLKLDATLLAYKLATAEKNISQTLDSDFDSKKKSLSGQNYN